MDMVPDSRAVGRIAARIDRLPITWAQWRLALITQLFWGVIIAADGVPGKLYPFIWGPRHAFGVAGLSVLLAVGNGVGILLGEYVIGLAADRWGRRAALLLSSLALGLLLWPTALTDNFYLLLLFFGLSSIGMGGVLAVNVVYMGEIVPPAGRGKVMLASQILAVVVYGLLGNLPAVFWVPTHYDWFIYLFSAVSIVVLVPLALWGMPESPRWLEAHGRHEQAERVTTGLEAECLRRSGLSGLPEPDYAKYSVPVTSHVPVRELLGGQYGMRTILLLIVWTLAYSGMFYGFGGYIPSVLNAYHLDADNTFAVLLVSTVVGGGLGLAICSLLGESVERRQSILVAALINAAALGTFFFIHSVVASYVLITVSWGAAMVLLFNLYNYTAASYPTRLRATGVGVTDGVGHLGSIFGPIVAGALFAATAAAGFVGWYAYITIPGALIPAALVAWFGINQRRAILEHISA
ncbi:MAG TPA: MFS transporter [Rhodopila sp.]